ncbi:hypothetical protein N2601_31150 (plasmid) [Rhizobium sp. CB3060]|uniref:hypothetical protein n=1 Tax=Rhizobium sp. CB3060 TaxID=3138255 RepID=UPI0021A5FAB9|nr:hypothetical protein [Rhizobium tropici]UWU25447.1 hypothetical protein N2601_31150 [Rhizobium tropici]
MTEETGSPDDRGRSGQLVPETASGFRKDMKLDRLAERFNVAQFVSFAPSHTEPEPQFSRLAGYAPNIRFPSLDAAVRALLEGSPERSVNIRSFTEAESQSREFIYGIKSVEEAVSAVRRMASEGAYTIVNETVDVSDGGVSGVAMGGLVEFRPDATPRGVERSGFASLPTEWASRLLAIVYGFDPGLDASQHARVEFSLHPIARGWKRSHILFWEYGEIDEFDRTAHVAWPNDFSRLVGDKVYGLLIAHMVGVPVPKTIVVPRRIAPFVFGDDTGSAEQWIRTSPVVQVPGKFTTEKGWRDPFLLVHNEDPDGTALASILSQQSVSAFYSGAAIEGADGEFIVEGTKGQGDAFMLGSATPELLPNEVLSAVASVRARLRQLLGSVRFEWVYDGAAAWVVQLHVGASQSVGLAIVPGEAGQWVDFDVRQGLEALRQLLASLPADTGVRLNGSVGRTSHIADVVRKANVPTRIVDGDRT